MLIKDQGRLFRLKVPRSLKAAYVGAKGLALVANKEFKTGERVAYLRGKLVDAANASPEAVQVTDKKFIDTKYFVPEDFINHSCSPNTKLDIGKRRFVAVKGIARNDEVTFNYLTTEWDMKRFGTDFKCACGSKNCLGHIKGFRYLSRTDKVKLRPLLSPFLLAKISQ